MQQNDNSHNEANRIQPAKETKRTPQVCSYLILPFFFALSLGLKTSCTESIQLECKNNNECKKSDRAYCVGALCKQCRGNEHCPPTDVCSDNGQCVPYHRETSTEITPEISVQEVQKEKGAEQFSEKIIEPISENEPPTEKEAALEAGQDSK